MTERWKNITGYIGYYQVSNLGNVRRIKFGSGVIRGPKTKSAHKNGYLYVHLSVQNQSRHYSIHRLMAIEFLGLPPTDKHEVRHLDGNRHNNVIGNLAWGTRKENALDMVKHGRAGRACGEKSGMSKLTENQVLIILSSPKSNEELAEQFNVVSSTISEIIHRRTWKHIKGRKQNKKNKLTANQVKVIKLSKDTGKELAIRFNISEENISAIRCGKIWKHVK